VLFRSGIAPASPRIDSPGVSGCYSGNSPTAGGFTQPGNFAGELEPAGGKYAELFPPAGFDTVTGMASRSDEDVLFEVPDLSFLDDIDPWEAEEMASPRVDDSLL